MSDNLKNPVKQLVQSDKNMEELETMTQEKWDELDLGKKLSRIALNETFRRKDRPLKIIYDREELIQEYHENKHVKTKAKLLKYKLLEEGHVSKQEYNVLKEQCEAKESNIKSLMKEIKKLETKSQQREKEIMTLEKDISRYNAEITENREMRSDMRKILFSKSEDIERLKNKRISDKNKINRLLERVSALETELSIVKAELSELKIETQKVPKLETEAFNLKAELSELKEFKKWTINQFIEINEVISKGVFNNGFCEDIVNKLSKMCIHMGIDENKV